MNGSPTFVLAIGINYPGAEITTASLKGPEAYLVKGDRCFAEVAPRTGGGGMTVLRVNLGDQLSSQLDIVAEAHNGKDVFLLAEVMTEATYVRHHVKRIAFLFTAMRHFAEARGCSTSAAKEVRIARIGYCWASVNSGLGVFPAAIGSTKSIEVPDWQHAEIAALYSPYLGPFSPEVWRISAKRERIPAFPPFAQSTGL